MSNKNKILEINNKIRESKSINEAIRDFIAKYPEAVFFTENRLTIKKHSYISMDNIAYAVHNQVPIYGWGDINEAKTDDVLYPSKYFVKIIVKPYIIMNL